MWEYRASLLRVVDGDTLRVLADLGFDARHEVELRLLDVSAPERSQPGGAESSDWVRGWMAGLPLLTWPLLIRTVRTTTTEPTERRTFTRYLGVVSAIDSGRVLNDELRAWLATHPDWPTGM